MKRKSKPKAEVVIPIPTHHCIYCGKELQPTAISLKRWLGVDTNMARDRIATFYECECSGYDLQVLTKAEREAFIATHGW